MCVFSQYSDSSQVERLMRWIQPSLCMLMLQTPVIIMIHKIESLACSMERSVFCVHVTVCVCVHMCTLLCVCVRLHAGYLVFVLTGGSLADHHCYSRKWFTSESDIHSV